MKYLNFDKIKKCVVTVNYLDKLIVIRTCVLIELVFERFLFAEDSTVEIVCHKLVLMAVILCNINNVSKINIF